MELSAIAKEYDLQLTRNERNLIARLDPAVSQISGDRYEQRMKDLATARQTLKQLPDKQTSERQRRSEKAAMLKQRLKMLHQIIPFISPSAAKSLKAEMKQIAAQLAALGAGGGAAGGNPTAPNEATIAETGEPGDQAENAQAGDDRTGREQPASSVVFPQNTLQSGDSSEDRQWKETVEELKNLYKTVLTALKQKQQSGRGNRSAIKFPPDLRVYASLDPISSFDFKA